MAKKAKKEEVIVSAPVATTPAPVLPSVNAAGSLRAMMKAANVQAAPVASVDTGGPEDIKIEDPVLLGKINALIEEAAKQRAAEGRKKSLDADIRPSLISRWFDKCRAAKSFIKTIKVNGLLNFGSPQLSIGKPNPKSTPPLTQDGIADGLMAFFGEKYSKYIRETFTLRVKAAKTTQADMLFLQQALDRVELSDAATDILMSLAQESLNKKKTPEMEAALTELKTRKARVQGKTFSEYFDHEFGLDFVEESIGSEQIVVVKKDMALDPVFEAQVRKGIAMGLLGIGNGSITPNGDAVAAAEARLVQDEIKRLQQNSNMANAAAAGAAAGVAMAAKSA